MPSASIIVNGVRALLAAMPFDIPAVLIYGSVARERHHTESDVDAMVFTDQPLSRPEKTGLVTAYVQFEVDLGLRPDPEYPLEVFDLDTCRSVLGMAHPPGSDRQPCSFEDAREILYALATPCLVVIGHQLIADLRAAAHKSMPSGHNMD